MLESRSLDRERLIRVMLAEISRQIDVYGDVRDEVALADAVLALLETVEDLLQPSQSHTKES